jgi:hypothetical protein
MQRQLDKLENRIITFTKQTFEVLRLSRSYYFIFLILIIFTNSVFINFLFDSNNSNRRLFLQLNLFVLITAAIFFPILENRIKSFKRFRYKLHLGSSLLIVISLFSILSIVLYVMLKSFQFYRLDGRGLEYLVATSVVLTFYVYSYLIFCIKDLDRSEIDIVRNFIYFLVGILAIVSLSMTRTYEYYVNYSINTKILFYTWAIFGIYLLSKFETVSKITNFQFKSRAKRIILSLTVFILVFVLSFRSDYVISVTGSSFHWSYFTGVMKTVRSGGHLLVDTPSQYGFLNVLLPALIPIEDTRSAFYIFQSLLLVLFSLIYIFTITKTNIYTKNKIFLIIIPILLIFFADPVLIGPQLYPSSSVVRFLPSTLTAIYLMRRRFTTNIHLRELFVLTSLMAFNLLWSGESFLYSSFILFVYLTCTVMFQDTVENLIYKFKKLFVLFLKFTSLFLMTMLLVSLLFKSIFKFWPDYGLLFFYPTKYARGFGSTELIYNAPFWFPIIIALFLALLSVRVKNYQDKNALIIAGSIIIIWMSYYFGRSVADNIIAIYPVIIIIVFVAISNIDFFKSYIESRMLIVIVLTFIYLWGLSSVLSPNFSKTFSQLRTFSEIPIGDPIQASESLSNDLEILSKKYDSPPIAYFGQGNLPFIDKDKFPTVNTIETFIPSPTGLLEAPLNTEERISILTKFYANVKVNDGLWVMDKNNFPDRADQWQIDLGNFFNCEQKIEQTDYRILYCKR